MRPYVLRSYFDTNLELAERHGKITDSDRKFFMGRVGDIDRRYTTGKAQLPPDVIEEMRKSFQESSGFLVTEEAKASDHYSPLGYPTLPAWAMPEEYGTAIQELLRLREKEALALEEFKREFQRVQELRIELERLRQAR